MEYIEGYRYTDELDAKAACESCTAFYSPLPDGMVWCVYFPATSEGVKIYYIPFDESLTYVLGEPEKFAIDNENPTIA